MKCLACPGNYGVAEALGVCMHVCVCAHTVTWEERKADETETRSKD